MSAKKAFNAEAFNRAVEINQVNGNGTNKFFEAIEKDKTALIGAMIREGADLDFRTEEQGAFQKFRKRLAYATGSTPLHAACAIGNPVVIAMLLDKRPKVNATNNEGYTPLDYALLCYDYCKEEHGKKNQSRFTMRRTVDRAEQRVDAFAFTILRMVRAGARPGLFILPPEFADAKNPEQKALPSNLPKT